MVVGDAVSLFDNQMKDFEFGNAHVEVRVV